MENLLAVITGTFIYWSLTSWVIYFYRAEIMEELFYVFTRALTTVANRHGNLGELRDEDKKELAK